MTVAAGQRARPVLVSLFRYSMQEHEAMANTYPHVLALLGAEVDVHHFCSRGPARHWVADRPGVQVHELPLQFRRGNERDKWLKTLLWYFVALRAAWWARRQQAALIYMEESLPWLPTLLGWVSGRPVVMSAADIFWDVYLPDGGLAGRIKRSLLRVDMRLWKRLRGLITHTQAFKDYAVELGLQPRKIFVVPEACAPTIFFRMDRAAARREAGYGGHEVIILHHGILAPNKALDRMLDYLAPLLRERPDVRLEFAGDGPLRKVLEAKAASLQIAGQVRFLGWLPRVAQLNVLLNAADISLVMREGRFSDHFQVTANLLHSLACGCTILTANLKGVAELIEEGRNGLIFDPTDGVDFRRQLARLLAAPALRTQLGSHAWETARDRLDPAHITSQWAAAIRELMQTEDGTA